MKLPKLLYEYSLENLAWHVMWTWKSDDGETWVAPMYIFETASAEPTPKEVLDAVQQTYTIIKKTMKEYYEAGTNHTGGQGGT